MANLQTIVLAGTQLELSDTTGAASITGLAAGVAVSGGTLSRVFQVEALVTASISGMTITGGRVFGDGGGLLNLGTLTLTTAPSATTLPTSAPAAASTTMAHSWCWAVLSPAIRPSSATAAAASPISAHWR
jgi:hypothetical protein